LSKQLEQNVTLIGDLNNELLQREKALGEHRKIVASKDAEIGQLTQQLGLM
jgi:hypothetical protein